MYINQIDDLIDKILDDFYNNIILRDLVIKKLLNETNFSKYHNDITNIMKTYMESINVQEIRDILRDEDNVILILKIIKRYIAYYLYLTIGFFYKDTDEQYINNIIDITKNHQKNKTNAEEFYNSENNANIIKFHKIIKNILIYLDCVKSNDNEKIKKLTLQNDFNTTFDFLNELGKEYIDVAFTLKSVNNKINEQAYNIIKTIIILLIYKKEEKKEVFKLLEMIEQEKGEYMFIDVVVPKRQYIDFSSIEEILTSDEIKMGLAHDIWDYLTKNDDKGNIVFETVDDKIHKLLKNKYILPITDDFLLYHKDTERYDKNATEQTKKKKEDTKIRYIINKIDTFSEYYSVTDIKVQQNIRKLLYMPLIDRRVILHNGIEEIRIINKLLNQGKRSVENNEFYNDLINYRNYPYICFKDMAIPGFSIVLDSSIDIVRSINFDKSGDFKQNDRNLLQTRIGTKDMHVNIVGFMIPQNISALECIHIKDVINIRTLDNKKHQKANGYKLFLQYLEQNKLQNKKHKSSVYWLFDIERDFAKLTTYEQMEKLTDQEQVRHFTANMYNDLLKISFKLIINELNNIKNVRIDQITKFIYQIEKKYIKISDNIDLQDELEKYIYTQKLIKIEPSYDIKDDIFNGLSNNYIKLYDYKKKIKKDIFKIYYKLSLKNIIINDIESDIIDAICQHNISWNHIAEIRKKDQVQQNNMIHEFVQQYVMENSDQDYICKSCGSLLPIKKYVSEGKWDDETGKFIIFSLPMEIPLEDIPEYEKYRAAIRNIEKIIERIASIVNMPSFTGTMASVRWKRKSVTKTVIDIVNANNNIFKFNYKERNEMSSKLYGVVRELSDIFIFDLDNSIFVYSSKEKDFHRHLKHNNIVIYIMITMILELNESHIGFLYGDKKGLCNYNIYEKYGQVLFDGLKIRKNNKGDLVPIKNYKLFCYIIYLVSCMATKYNLWYREKSNGDKKFNPTVQKIIIHTFIDILNSILENNSKNNKNYVFESISVKFYNKLQVLYSNDEILYKLKRIDSDNIILPNLPNQKLSIVTKYKPFDLLGYYQPLVLDLSNDILRRLPKYYVQYKKHFTKYNKTISNISNCIDGNFHIWNLDNNSFKCSLCKIKTIDLVYDKKMSDDILNNYKYIELNKIANVFCNNGSLHNYIYDDSNKCSVCIRCKTNSNYLFSEKELNQLYLNIKKQISYKNDKHKKKLEHSKQEIAKHDIYSKRVIQKITDKYNEHNSRDKPYNFIEEFINTIQAVIGTEIIINGVTIYLSNNSYIIDHDFNGNKLDKPIIISDNDNKLTIKQNHSFFKTDVIYYTDTRNGKIDVFYDAITNILLGYKEINKDYVSIKKLDRKITVIYSLFNRLKFLGHESQFINIEDKINICNEMNYDNSAKCDSNIIIIDVVRDIIRNRIHNLKKSICDFQRYIYRIKFGRQTKKENKNNLISDKFDKFDKFTFIEETSDLVSQLIDSHQRKIINMNIADEESGEHMVFKHWKAIINNIFADSLSDKAINIDSRLAHIDDINKYDSNGNLLLFYMVTELHKLITYNSNKFSKTFVINFIIECINALFNLFNKEYVVNIFDVKRFEYILNSSGYLYDIEQKGHGIEDVTTGIYSEIKDDDGNGETDEQKEAKYDMEEEADALDVENAEDIEAELDRAYMDYYEN